MPKLTNQKKLNEWSGLYLGNFNAHLDNFLMQEICRQDRHGCWHRYCMLPGKTIYKIVDVMVSYQLCIQHRCDTGVACCADTTQPVVSR